MLRALVLVLLRDHSRPFGKPDALFPCPVQYHYSIENVRMIFWVAGTQITRWQHCSSFQVVVILNLLSNVMYRSLCPEEGVHTSPLLAKSPLQRAIGHELAVSVIQSPELGFDFRHNRILAAGLYSNTYLTIISSKYILDTKRRSRSYKMKSKR